MKGNNPTRRRLLGVISEVARALGSSMVARTATTKIRPVRCRSSPCREKSRRASPIRANAAESTSSTGLPGTLKRM